MPPFEQLGEGLGVIIDKAIAPVFEMMMRAIWDASLIVLRGAFALADNFSMFTVDTRTGPVSILWPMMLWISGILALGLFFWQLIMTNLRGGRGFVRLVTGPVQYGIALAVTVGMVAAFLVGVDALTAAILEYGLRSENFTDALNQTSFADGVADGFTAIVLAICAFIGVIPAALGYILEMLFREAAVYLLVATVPLSAAGLITGATSSWYWRTCRWMLACIAMKPVLALALTLGVAISGGAQGLSGLLAGVGVLIISLFCPFVLFRLFAFVDPNSDAGAAFRDALSGAGVDSYGGNSPAMLGAGAMGGSGGGGAMEVANTGRFDSAVADHAGNTMDESGVGQSSGDQHDDDAPDGVGHDSGGGNSGGVDSGGSDGGSSADGDASAVPPAANAGSVVSSSPSSGPSGSYGDFDDGGNGGGGGSGGGGGGDEPPPEPPGPGSDPHGGGGGGPTSGGGGSEAAAEEAAVIV